MPSWPRVRFGHSTDLPLSRLGTPFLGGHLSRLRSYDTLGIDVHDTCVRLPSDLVFVQPFLRASPQGPIVSAVPSTSTLTVLLIVNFWSKACDQNWPTCRHVLEKTGVRRNAPSRC